MTEQQAEALRELVLGLIVVGALVLGVGVLPLFFPCVYHGGTRYTLFGISACADGTFKVRQ